MRKLLTILLAYIPAGFVIGSLLLVTVLKWAPVTITPLMISRGIHSICKSTGKIKHQWVSLDDISEKMIKAVIAGEDQHFLHHQGFDYDEIPRMKLSHLLDGTPIRGCSTISQQTAKNCFTFCSRSWLRKGIEAYYTVLIEKIWGKRRILEVYLNVAEMGPGIFGIEAAAEKYYHIHSFDLTISDASSLVCCLPNPQYRSPEWANRHMSKRRYEIARLCNDETIPSFFVNCLKINKQ